MTRRDLSLLLPLLATSGRSEEKTLPTKVYHDKDLAYQGDDKKKGRQFFDGVNRSGYRLQMHETILGPGTQTHAPHKHEHEEIIVVFDGTVETWVEGKTEIAEKGSVIYFASNQMHSSRNAGSDPCRYYVIELRGK